MASPWINMPAPGTKLGALEGCAKKCFEDARVNRKKILFGESARFAPFTVFDTDEGNCVDFETVPEARDYQRSHGGKIRDVQGSLFGGF